MTRCVGGHARDFSHLTASAISSETGGVTGVTNVYMYADETGNLDYNVGSGGSRYFGIGTATWTGEPAEHLWHSERMRFGHAAAGIECPRGYHAKDDSRTTRNEVYQVIKDQAPRFDTTFLAKENAYPHVKARGQIYLYKLAWFLHFKEIAQQVTQRGDFLFVAVATLGTSSRKAAFRPPSTTCARRSGRSCATSPWLTGTLRRAGGSRSPTTVFGRSSGASNEGTTTICGRWSRACTRSSCRGAGRSSR